MCVHCRGIPSSSLTKNDGPGICRSGVGKLWFGKSCRLLRQAERCVKKVVEEGKLREDL
jgi:hypothetical protein